MDDSDDNIPSRITENFLSLFCEKNDNETQNLRLKGNELYFRIKQRVTDKDMVLISNYLLANPKVIRLELPYNNVSDVGLVVLIKICLSNPENMLEHLNLLGCDISYQGIRALSQTCETLKLKSLRLTGNKIGSGNGSDLENILLNVPTLEILDLGDTNQTAISIPYICSALRSDIGSNTTLKVLDVSSIVPVSKYYQSCSSMIAEHFGNMIKMNSSLIELHMGKCDLDGHDFELLLMGLKRNTTLLFLDLGYNRIGNFGAQLLSDWFKTTPALTGLNIAGCGIGEHGARSLSFGVSFCNLKLLDISQNKINDQGMSEFLMGLRKAWPIRQLFIWGNELGPKTIPVFE